MRTLRIMMTMMMMSQVEGVSPADVSERTDSGLGLNFENLEMSLSRENLQLSRSDLERLFGKKKNCAPFLQFDKICLKSGRTCTSAARIWIPSILKILDGSKILMRGIPHGNRAPLPVQIPGGPCGVRYDIYRSSICLINITNIPRWAAHDSSPCQMVSRWPSQESSGSVEAKKFLR